MVIKLNQIFTLLNIVKLFEDDKNSKPDLVSIKKILKHSPLELGQFLEIEELIKFCSDSNLIKIDEGVISTNEFFDQILTLLKSGKTEKIKSLLRKNFLENKIIRQFFLIGASNFNNDNDNYWMYMDQVVDSFNDSKFIDILWALDIIQGKKNLVILNPELNIFEINIKKIQLRPQTQAQFDDIKAIQKQVGEIAEKFVIEFEKQRLKKEYCDEKIDKINQISITNTRAGYDIESFNDKSSLSHDRFIEVKGSVNKKFDIHWSVNEINKAEELQDKYWLYFVSEIDPETGMCPNAPEPYPNPFVNIYQNQSEFDQNIEGYHIKRK